MFNSAFWWNTWWYPASEFVMPLLIMFVVKYLCLHADWWNVQCSFIKYSFLSHSECLPSKYRWVQISIWLWHFVLWSFFIITVSECVCVNTVNTFWMKIYRHFKMDWIHLWNCTATYRSESHSGARFSHSWNKMIGKQHYSIDHKDSIQSIHLICFLTRIFYYWFIIGLGLIEICSIN